MKLDMFLSRRTLLWCLWLQLGSRLALAQRGPVQNSTKWNFTKPLRVCSASVEDFGSRCNGSPIDSWESLDGPAEGWCAHGVDFCGYDIDVWKRVAGLLGLKENEHYVRVCMGEFGFGPMIDDLARLPFHAMETKYANQTHPGKDYLCDIGASSITATSERARKGIMFSRATHRSHLAVMVLAPLQPRGRWAFFQPLASPVWLSLGATILIVPFFVFFFEAVFSAKCIYRDRFGELNVLWGIKEAMWHSVSHTLSIDVFRVTSLPARIVTAAYAFLVLILANTYTANLAAFLTVSQMDLGISGIKDLRGKSVGTLPTYTARLYHNHRIIASAVDGWDHTVMEQKLLDGTYQAIISDSQHLTHRSNRDATCSLNLLPGIIEPFDIAFAFHENFPYEGLPEAVDDALIELQESGVLSKVGEANSYPEPNCRDDTEFAETNQVNLESVYGVWLLLAACVGLAAITAVFEYFWWLRGSPDKRAVMRARAFTLVACGHRGDPDAWARTESLRARAKQDLPPTSHSSSSGLGGLTEGITGGITALLRRTGRPRTTDDVGLSRLVGRRGRRSEVPRGRQLQQQRDGGLKISPQGLQAIIHCVEEERAAEEEAAAEDAAEAGLRKLNGEEGEAGSGAPEISRMDTWDSNNGGVGTLATAASRNGSGQPPLLRIVSSCGGPDALCTLGGSASRISKECADHTDVWPQLSSFERNELPDPNHVLGTVTDPADAFRMSTTPQMRSATLIDEQIAEEIGTSPDAPHKTSATSSLERTASMHSRSEAPAVRAAGGLRAGGGLRVLGAEEDKEVAAAARRGAQVAAAMQYGRFMPEAGSTPKGPRELREQASVRHVFVPGQGAGKEAEQRRMHEDGVGAGLTAGPHAVSYDSLADCDPQGSLAAAGGSGSNAQGSPTGSAPAEDGQAGAVQLEAALDHVVSAAVEQPAVTAAAVEVLPAVVASGPPAASAAQRQAPRMTELLQVMCRGPARPPPLVAFGGAADQAGPEPADGAVDSGVELRRLKSIVARLAAHLDHMLDVHARDTGKLQ
eukprot:jgi/Ulvmu1/10983/UM007_0162.1